MVECTQMNTEPQYQRMLYAAWANWGAFNAHDGSEDGDVNTLQRNRRAEVSFTNDRELTLDEMKRKVQIRRRTTPTRSGNDPIPRRQCPYRPRDYDITALDEQSRLHERPMTLWERNTMRDCDRVNAPQQAIYDELIGKDLSNAVYAQPDTRCMITPADIQVLHQVVSELRGEEEADLMQTRILGLPIRSKMDGTILKPPSWQPLVNWTTMIPIPHVPTSDECVRDSIVQHFRIPGLIEEGDGDEKQSDTITVHGATLHKQTVLSDLQFLNPNWSQQDLAVHAPFIQRHSTLLPESGDSIELRISMQAAARGGGRRGLTAKSGYEMARAFVMFVVSNGSLFKMKWQHVDQGDQPGTEHTREGTMHIRFPISPLCILILTVDNRFE